jgi:hypothetical protein
VIKDEMSMENIISQPSIHRIARTGESSTVFKIRDQDVEIFVESFFVRSIPRRQFGLAAAQILEAMKREKTSSISIPKLDDFLRDAQVKNVKLVSKDKRDLEIKYSDPMGDSQTSNFSVRSQISGRSTLFNVSKATNITFRVIGVPSSSKDLDFLFIEGTSLREKLSSLQAIGGDLKYFGYENRTFESNLMLVDSQMPTIFAQLVKDYYWHSISHVTESIKNLIESDPVDSLITDKELYYSENVQRLLSSIALGMKNASPWNAEVDFNGGYIHIMPQGAVIAIPFSSPSGLKRFLLANTKFDTPDKRFGFGIFERESRDIFIRLNAQIRFLR